MKTYGIRILDGNKNVLRTTLHEILEEIEGGSEFYWCILFLDGTPAPGHGHFLAEYKKKINDSKNGEMISWKELKSLTISFFQMFETTVLGCRDKELLYRYENEKDMYKSCDIVIDLIDCAFWEIYTKELKFIEKLKSKFNEIELLDPIY